MCKSKLALVKFGIIFFFGLTIFCCKEVWGAEYNVTLGMDGDVLFVKKGWFKNEFYPIHLIRGEWHWKSPDGWKRIATPYESVFDRGGRIIVLGEHGQIYLRIKDRTEKYPLKVINGTWHCFEGGEWLEIPFDVD
jgi:hypothetical protein